jgi:AcrR family transcriptional regulator
MPDDVMLTTVPRRRMSREARARQLLDVAEAVFTEQGVASSSMDEIADRAGVTKPILYDHFGSKDRLVAAVLLRAGATLGEAIVTEVGAASSPQDALARGVRAYFSFIEQRRNGLHSLLTEAGAPGSESAAALERVRDQQAELITTLLMEQTDDDDEATARVYAQIVLGATERLATRPGTAAANSVQTLTSRVMDVFWCGFAAISDGARWESPDRP